MSVAQSMFQLGNFPYFNARFEIYDLLQQFNEPAFEESLRQGKLSTPLWSWQGQPHELVTDLMRRSIVALEAYVIGAVRLTALNASRWSEALEEQLANPFALTRRGAADAYYNKVPALLAPEYSLQTSDETLWSEVSVFYRGTRNPLFHGHMITEAEIAPLKAAHALLARMYRWIDSWSTYIALPLPK